MAKKTRAGTECRQVGSNCDCFDLGAVPLLTEHERGLRAAALQSAPRVHAPHPREGVGHAMHNPGHTEPAVPASPNLLHEPDYPFDF